jgi:opacity protein-like surface antigen
MVRYGAACAIVIIMSTSAFAKSGDKTLSVGIFGQYAIDGGPVEDTASREYSHVYDANYAQDRSQNKTSTFIGGGAYLRYLFDNGIFFRAGAESYKLFKDIHTSGTSDAGNYGYDSKISNSAQAFPVYAGIKMFEKNNDIGVYAAVGFVTSKVKYDISREYYSSPNTYTSDISLNETIFGFGAILGIEKTFFKSINVGIEYAFYKCEKKFRVTETKYYSWGTFYSANSVSETLGLPRHLVRVCVSYNIF